MTDATTVSADQRPEPIRSRHDDRYQVTMYRYVGVQGAHTLDFLSLIHI